MSSPVVVVVFHQQGCPACEKYLPKFRRVAAQYGPLVEGPTPPVYAAPAPQVPSAAYDIGDRRLDQIADSVAGGNKVQYTPTTMALARPSGRIIRDGDLDEAELHGLFQAARRHRLAFG